MDGRREEGYAKGSTQAVLDAVAVDAVGLLQGVVYGCAALVDRHELAHLLGSKIVDHHADEGFGLSIEEDQVVGAAWNRPHARYGEEAVLAYCALEGSIV